MACQDQQIAFADLDSEAQDWVVAEFLLDLRADEPLQRQRGTVLVAALQKITPSRLLRTSKKVLESWGRELPIRQAPACPDRVLYAIVILLQAWNEREAACTALLCFCGLLRVSEGLALTSQNLVFGTDFVVLLLGTTKRGIEDRVVLRHPSVLWWLRSYCAWRSAPPGDRLFPLSYWVFQRRLQQAATALDFGALQLTSHSLRRGGATQLLRAGVNFSDICLFGRWRSERSAKEYLRVGEVALTRASQNFSVEDWARLEKVIALRRLAWLSRPRVRGK